jgi:hypothetical protein
VPADLDPLDVREGDVAAVREARDESLSMGTLRSTRNSGRGDEELRFRRTPGARELRLGVLRVGILSIYTKYRCRVQAVSVEVARSRSNRRRNRCRTHKRLDALIGRWNTEGRTTEASGVPAERIEAVETYERLPGGALLHFVDATVGDRRVEGAEIIGFDPHAGATSRSISATTGPTRTRPVSSRTTGRERNVITGHGDALDDDSNWLGQDELAESCIRDRRRRQLCLSPQTRGPGTI